jgi:hypothetical protein
MVAAVTGNEPHQIEFVSESYGGGKKKATNATKTAEKGEEVLEEDDTKYGPSTRRLSTFGASTLLANYGRTASMMCMESSDEESDE